MINSPCVWGGGKLCPDPHNCNDCAVKDRESKTYPEHVIEMLLREKMATDIEWNCALEYACKCISFATEVCRIIETEEYPEYAQDEIISAIEDFRNG